MLPVGCSLSACYLVSAYFVLSALSIWVHSTIRVNLQLGLVTVFCACWGGLLGFMTRILVTFLRGDICNFANKNNINKYVFFCE